MSINSQIISLNLMLSIHDDMKSLRRLCRKDYTDEKHEKLRKKIQNKIKKLLKHPDYYEAEPYGV